MVGVSRRCMSRGVIALRAHCPLTLTVTLTLITSDVVLHQQPKCFHTLDLEVMILPAIGYGLEDGPSLERCVRVDAARQQRPPANHSDSIGGHYSG